MSRVCLFAVIWGQPKEQPKKAEEWISVSGGFMTPVEKIMKSLMMTRPSRTVVFGVRDRGNFCFN